MRLIDVDAFIAEYCKNCGGGCDLDDECCSTVGDLEKAPTVDAVEVVRCKDCKYWEVGKDYEPYCNHCASGMWDTTADDFCSYGERKIND